MSQPAARSSHVDTSARAEETSPEAEWSSPGLHRGSSYELGGLSARGAHSEEAFGGSAAQRRAALPATSSGSRRSSSTATRLPGPGSSNALSSRQRALIGVARWPDPAYNDETAPKQKEYGKSFWNATRKTGAKISNGKITSLEDVWSHATAWRGKMARNAGSSSIDFGDSRRTPSETGQRITGLGDRYSYIKDRYIDHEGRMLRDGGQIEGMPFNQLPPQVRFQMSDVIAGEPVLLTSTVVSTNPHLDRTQPPYSVLQSRGLRQLGEPYHFDHTPSAVVPRIMAHAESLFQRALDPNIDNHAALTTMGELHWWLAHAMPDERGSAAKAEFCVRSIAQARGMDLPPFQHGVVPDLEAMTTPRAVFVSQYPRLFEGT